MSIPICAKSHVPQVSMRGLQKTISTLWSSWTLKSTLDLAKQGLNAREISEKLDMKLNRVYYLLRKNKDDVKFDDYKRKYDYSEVRALKEDGLKPKEISEKLNIPLRSVYYILNKK